MSAPVTHGYGYQEPSRRIKGIVVVVVVHVLIGYALVSGMARDGLKLIKKPLEAVVIQEVIIPPPPPPPPAPPPPKQAKAPQQILKPEAPPPPFVPPAEVTPAITSTPPPAIVSTPTPAPAPVVIAPPPPVAPPTVNPNRSDIGVACPIQVPPEMPRRAMRDGIGGVVKAQARIKDGEVKEVTILSGPRVFHTAVRDAMMQYKCTRNAEEMLAVQEFNFTVE